MDNSFKLLSAALLQVLVKNIFHPALVIGTQLAVGKPLVKPKFSSGIVCQRFPKRLRVGKGNHGVSRGMDQENRNRGIASVGPGLDI